MKHDNSSLQGNSNLRKLVYPSAKDGDLFIAGVRCFKCSAFDSLLHQIFQVSQYQDVSNVRLLIRCFIRYSRCPSTRIKPVGVKRESFSSLKEAVLREKIQLMVEDAIRCCDL
ncbi:hypothetical protein CEXT_426311 [Caerostris extrusa]|uniref:Uncharacterized protein n=1 Tax=Caerostris extrusa TaxID=172846 RepID=A0AAV4SVQ6_CAEEX|nr:hypothetical protein CEXT_426311 [Caerostris extrusa]